MEIQCIFCRHGFAGSPSAGGRITCPVCDGEFEASESTQILPSSTERTEILPSGEEQTVLTGRAASEDSYVPFSDPEMMPDTAQTEYQPPSQIVTPPRFGGSGLPPTATSAPTAMPGAYPAQVVQRKPAPPSSSAMAIEATELLDSGTADAVTRPPSAPAPTTGRSHSFGAPGAASTQELVGRNLNGYVVKRPIGAGGMGAVFLAHQMSLDREIALKVLPPHLSLNPDFLARFTREALSAAQLNHHNIVQVFDVGSVGDTHYISMEFVRGDSLGSMTKQGGKLAVEDAAGYVLQVARGLAYAHDNGIIHRDIKPDNVMVNEHGVVKIADLGLAKMRNVRERSVGIDSASTLHEEALGDLTGTEIAMGTPAYMAPEQGRDASKVDHRADQYSLGCTLYYLVAGKTPFTGKTTFELISKHASEPIIPLDTIVKNVPKELSYIIEKMLAKLPADRYPSMHEVVAALGAYLGVEMAQGPYTPREHHVAVLEKAQAAYYGVSALKLRMVARALFVVVTLLVFGVCAAMGAFFPAAAALGLLVLTPVFHFVINGFATKGYFFRRVRSVFFGMRLKGWSTLLVGLAFGTLVLYFLNLLGPWLAVTILGVVLALAYEFVIARKLRSERIPPIAETQEMLKQLRVRGVSEDALQDFVYRFSSANWEEFFEEIFGYEDMILKRGTSAKREKTAPRKKVATWRDPIARWLDEVEESRRRVREQRQLAKAEKNRLKAGGMDEAAADAKSQELAQEAMDSLPKTLIISSRKPTRDEIDAIDMELAQAKRAHGKLFWIFRFVRAAVGLLAFTGAVLPIIHSRVMSLPDVIGTVYTPYYGLGNQTRGYELGIAGILLLVSVFSQRVLLPGLLLAGALIMALSPVLASLIANPSVTAGNLYWVGMLASAAGFLGLIFGKSGGRF